MDLVLLQQTLQQFASTIQAQAKKMATIEARLVQNESRVIELDKKLDRFVENHHQLRSGVNSSLMRISTQVEELKATNTTLLELVDELARQIS